MIICNSSPLSQGKALSIAGSLWRHATTWRLTSQYMSKLCAPVQTQSRWTTWTKGLISFLLFSYSDSAHNLWHLQHTRGLCICLSPPLFCYHACRSVATWLYGDRIYKTFYGYTGIRCHYLKCLNLVVSTTNLRADQMQCPELLASDAYNLAW